ncbi:unnamed protein product [Polarella glacialis]|uniref:EF-hand domain-containing protein n=1 Tax=Polarella glacialis TaxID=89957 RepID=A0A813JPG9_POLGL|nr:unnamed protein product [Polarella glacialis]
MQNGLEVAMQKGIDVGESFSWVKSTSQLKPGISEDARSEDSRVHGSLVLNGSDGISEDAQMNGVPVFSGFTKKKGSKSVSGVEKAEGSLVESEFQKLLSGLLAQHVQEVSALEAEVVRLKDIIADLQSVELVRNDSGYSVNLPSSEDTTGEEMTESRSLRQHVTDFLENLNKSDPQDLPVLGRRPSQTGPVVAEGYSGSLRHKLEYFLQSGRFEFLISLLLCANVLFLASELQYHGSISGYNLSLASYSTPIAKQEDWPTIDAFFVDGDFVFTALFCIDVAVRIAVLRSRFWAAPINWLDFVVVATSFVAMVQSLPISPMFLRLLRVGKLARALRLVTTSNALQSLQLLLKCLESSIDMLCWSFILLVFIQSIAGMIIANLARDYIEDESNDLLRRKEVFMFYGTFTRTFLTMFEILFANWAPACRVLVENVSEWFSLFFLVYRCFIGFAVINVLSAVFVQQTLKTATSDEELSFKQKQKDQTKYAAKVKQLFKSVDVSSDGQITFDEFSALVENPKLKFWMGQLELEYHDLLGLFEMLDDGDGEISLEEFVEGAGRLKGAAKTIDIWRLETKLEIMLTRLLALSTTSAANANGPLLESERPDLDQLFKAHGFEHLPVMDNPTRRASRESTVSNPGLDDSLEQPRTSRAQSRSSLDGSFDQPRVPSRQMTPNTLPRQLSPNTPRGNTPRGTLFPPVLG